MHRLTTSTRGTCPNRQPATVDLLACPTERALTIGMHRVALAVDDIDAAVEIVRKHGGDVLRGIAQYEDTYRLTYVRGPDGILVMLAQELRKAG